MKFELVPLNSINDEVKFFRGEKFRKYNVGLTGYGSTKEEDYYEYMIIETLEKDLMGLVIVGDGYGNQKAGIFTAFLKQIPNLTETVVPCREIKLWIGEIGSYWLKENNNNS